VLQGLVLPEPGLPGFGLAALLLARIANSRGACEACLGLAPDFLASALAALALAAPDLPVDLAAGLSFGLAFPAGDFDVAGLSFRAMPHL
jgi:hypothetical protein